MAQERDRIIKERLSELVQKLGTSNPECIKFRQLEKGANAFWFNHLDECVSCRLWLKKQGLDLNAIGNKHFQNDELQGYEEAFRGTEDREPQKWQDMTNENDKDVLEGLGRKEN
jgi:hypothetical protein